MIAISNAISIGLNRLGGGGPGPGPDPDAQAFFSRVAAAGGVLTEAEQTAVNQLVIDLKANSLWTPMKAIYPMVGASAAACAQNLKSSSFTGTFSSGWTFASTGVTPNGTSAYMDTALNPSTQLTVSSAYLSSYIRTNSSIGPAYDIGNSANSGADITPTFLISRYSNNFAFIGIADTSYATSTPSTNSIGFWNGGTNGSSTQKLFKNGSLLRTATAVSTVFTNSNLYVGANNFNGTAVLFSNKQTAFVSISTGLTDTQASNFYTAVQAFNTTLNRYVDAPWYDNGNLLLDTYPSAAAAYSVRKLRNNYIGGPIRVRRSSDNAEQDIYFDSNGNLDTAQLTTFCGAGDGFVTTWYDQSGNGRDAIQTTAIKQPQIVSAGVVFTNINSKPTLRFDGSNDSLQSASFTTISPPYTAFLVNKWISTSPQPYLMDLGRDSAIGRIDLSSPAKNGILFNFGGIVNSTRLINFTDNLLWFVLPNGTTSNLSINNETIVSGGTGTRSANQITFGDYGGGFSNANSYYSEFILYPLNQTTNRSGIEININSYYGIY